MKRLDRVEAAIGNIATILVDQSERIDGLGERIDGLGERIDGVHGEVRLLQQETHAFREAVTERLDRLIAVTISERTASIERLAEIERRLARLEDHAGF